jgi:hypothetical protein
MDVVDITGNFTITRSSNPSGEFDLSLGRVLFSGGGSHTHLITGLDFRQRRLVRLPGGFTPQNFAYGRLSIASASDLVLLGSGDGATTNAALRDVGGPARQHGARRESAVAPEREHLLPRKRRQQRVLERADVSTARLGRLVAGGLLMPALAALPEPSGLIPVAVAAPHSSRADAGPVHVEEDFCDDAQAMFDRRFRRCGYLWLGLGRHRL